MTYSSSATNRYLDARVSNASQPELQLMLLDGALRFGHSARRLWTDQGQQVEVERLLRRTRDIAEELVCGVSGGALPESKRLEEEYAFIFREVARAQASHDAAVLDGVLNLLAYQRETWRLACEKLKPKSPPAPDSEVDPSPAAGLSLQA